eukprot:273006-Hanusia_phi.AAC.2
MTRRPRAVSERRCKDEDVISAARMAGVKFPKLEVKREGGVRGMYATKKIDKGEVIVSVPPSLLFSYETAGGALRDVWRRTKDMQELDRLTLLLLYFSSKVRSRWDFFLCGIPGMKDLGPAVLWSSKKLNQTCARGDLSSLCSYVENRRSLYRKLWMSEIAPLPRKFPHIFSKEDTSYSNYLWAIAAVLSRMWLMRKFEDAEFFANGTWMGPAKWVMAPVAELLNHKPRAGGRGRRRRRREGRGRGRVELKGGDEEVGDGAEGEVEKRGTGLVRREDEVEGDRVQDLRSGSRTHPVGEAASRRWGARDGGAGEKAREGGGCWVDAEEGRGGKG